MISPLSFPLQSDSERIEGARPDDAGQKKKEVVEMRKVKTACDYIEEALGLVKETRELVSEHPTLFKSYVPFTEDPDPHLVARIESLEERILANWSTGDKRYARRLCYEARSLYRYVRGTVDAALE